MTDHRNLKTVACFILVLATKIDESFSNGRFLEPPSRSSMWRFPEFKHLNPPENYNDNHLDCGGKLVSSWRDVAKIVADSHRIKRYHRIFYDLSKTVHKNHHFGVQFFEFEAHLR